MQHPHIVEDHHLPWTQEELQLMRPPQPLQSLNEGLLRSVVLRHSLNGRTKGTLKWRRPHHLHDVTCIGMHHDVWCSILPMRLALAFHVELDEGHWNLCQSLESVRVLCSQRL